MKTIVLVFLLFSTAVYSQQDQKIIEAKNMYRQKNYETAENLFEDLMDDNTKNDSLYYYAGLNFMALKKYEEASEMLEQAVGITPSSSLFYLVLGNAYGMDARNSSIFSRFSLAKKCKSSYLKAVELAPENIDARVALTSYYYQAPGIAGGDTEEAYKQAAFIIKSDEKRGRALLTEIYIYEGEEKKAEDEFKLLDKKYGNDSTIYNVYNSYGYFLLKQNRVKEAIEKFKKQVELAPNNANAYDSLGDGYLAAGDKIPASKAFAKALEIDPGFKASKEKLDKIRN